MAAAAKNARNRAAQSHWDSTSRCVPQNKPAPLDAARRPTQSIAASSSGGNAIDITYNFVDPSTGKNASIVYGITNNLDTTRSQAFSYDQLNRLTSGWTTSTYSTSPAHCWSETFNVDPWGNLNTIAATTNSSYTGCSLESGFSTTADGNNHLPVWAYDASGNATSDGVVTNYVWNAESELKSAAGVTYTYDGDGRRVSKSNGKLYWYGSGGDILAETDASGNTIAEYIFFGGKRIAMLPAGSNPIYYFEDMLGTSRVLTTNTGVVCYDADFYPYGGERAYTNTCPQNYKFEGKERDTETGNDEFGARYYSNRFGRWLSADWSSVPVPVPYANLTNPQTLNLYAMVSDDPEGSVDLDGHGDAGTFCNQECRRTSAEYAAKHPVTAVLEPIAEFGTVPSLAIGGGAALGSAFLRNLLGLGLATAPIAVPLINEALEGLTPGQNLTLGRAGALGVSSIEKLGESGFVGALQNGARISAGFERAGSSLGVSVSSIETAAKGSINFKALQAGAESLARSEGASSVTITAVSVTNAKLAELLKKAGYVAQKITDKFGRETVNYVKTIKVPQ